MTRRTPVEEVLRFLGVDDPELLALLRSEGLFEAEEVDAVEAEELRVATVLVRELGVNAAGVDVALHLRRRLLTLQRRVELVLRDRAEGRERE